MALWDVSTGVFEKSVYVGNLDTSPRSVFFNPDGSKAFMVGVSSETVYRYVVSTPWDITTISIANSFYVGNQEHSPTDLFFKPNGWKLYIIGYGIDKKIHQYSLVNWYVGSATYDDKSLYVGDQDRTPYGLFFKPDGSEVYMAGCQSGKIYQYNLSTDWDISTGTYSGKSFDVNDIDIYPMGIFFKPDGSKMYINGGEKFKIFQFSLSTPWDITTAVYNNKSLYIGGQDEYATGLFFKPDGNLFYMTGGDNDKIYQYLLPGPILITAQAVTDIETTTATGNGNITDTKGENATKRGVCWNTTGNPTIADDKSEEEGDFGIGAFTSSMTGLTPGTTYYVKAYAYNSVGYAYSDEVEFTTILAVPTNVVATNGAHTDKVVITWDKSEGATAYQVYRDDVALGWLGDVDTYEDTEADAPSITPGSAVASDGAHTDKVALSLSGESANNGTAHTYKVRARNVNEEESEDSETDTGYRGAGSLTYQWQRSGGDSDASYSNISGATSAFYSDTDAPAPTITPGVASASDGTYAAHIALSLSGQSAVNGEGRYYRCILNADGCAQRISSSDRGYRKVGTLTYQWQRSAADSDVAYSNISGAITASYNDTNAPADGSGRYYRCVENATGAAQQISTTDRGYRMYSPTVATQAAASITGVSATLNGNITDAGGPITTRGFKYYKDGEPGTVLDVHEDGAFGEGVYDLSISGLVNGTKYYFWAYATNDAGTGEGSELDFTTEVYLPLVTTEVATNITIDYAKGNGTIVAGADITERGFEVVLAFSGSLQEYIDRKMAGFAGAATYNSATKKWEGTLTKTVTETGTFEAGAFTGNMGAFPTAVPSNRLFAGELHIYRARATNDIGVGYGSWVLFTTTYYFAGQGPDDQIPIDDVVGIFYYRKAYPKRDVDELREKCRLFQDNIVEYALAINHNSRVLQRFLNDLTAYTGADEYNTFRPIIPPQHLNALARKELDMNDFKAIINSFINNSVDNANNVNNNFQLVRGGLSNYAYTEDEGFVDISITTKVVTSNKPDVEGLTKVIDRLNREMESNYMVINHNSHVLRSILI